MRAARAAIVYNAARRRPLAGNRAGSDSESGLLLRLTDRRGGFKGPGSDPEWAAARVPV